MSSKRKSSITITLPYQCTRADTVDNGRDILLSLCIKSRTNILVESTGIRVTSLEVPDHVTRGHDVELRCSWDLTSHKLYSVKWYRDGQEFYRFLPSEDPPRATLPLRGVHVNESASTGPRVVLTRLDLDSSGRYKCEVISDWPEFHTADRSAILLVVGECQRNMLNVRVPGSSAKGKVPGTVACTDGPKIECQG
ncbi:uncharacterized protein LOC125042435 [Penaeus chinensis]|uniref:uncharacterized protein LOC125042435 n=1 Tax=Penaeus chinensis TaxID=139456 RepID=UPI001FB682E1|nr:uncharacterized protein LOC125042435 [Penaeus chinensis]